MTGRSGSVLLDREGAVTVLTLNRPARRNAVDVGLCEDLHATLRKISRSAARVVVLGGDDFCVGANLKNGG